ncbi:hypothetical protein [Bifidobacterium callitrichidarum]|uniref:Uncharacterized protein n=1 Tax=Bifidobacterium callitrichidarum TaxID=2052941 RepID=A0A2U2N8Z8_9BIFI|nr:hypothetical protein [Bifidobacterium callitrichidarum]PWG65645.1 hypothetical protein DF196_06850 [Bifidobacterium callitrichidarum]
MNAEDERFQHAYLNHFHYADRTDDGWGPDSPRVGDQGALCHGLDAEEFTVSVEPRTGLPSLHVGSRWIGLFETAIDPHMEVILHQRGPGRAETYTIGAFRFADLTPPYEGVGCVVWQNGRLHDADSMRPLVEESLDLEDALITLGYEAFEAPDEPPSEDVPEVKTRQEE